MRNRTQKLDGTSLNRFDNVRTLKLTEIVESIDADVFRLLRFKEIRNDPRILRRENKYFSEAYLKDYENAVKDSKEAADFKSEDFDVVMRRHMSNLGELTKRDVSLTKETIGKESFKKRRKKRLRKIFPVGSRVITYPIATTGATTILAGAILNFRYTTQTHNYVTNATEGAFRWLRGMNPSESFRVWQEPKAVQWVFDATLGVDRYVLNSSVTDLIGATWPYLVSAGLIGLGVGYVKGRTQKKISSVQLKYEMFEEDRKLLTSNFVNDLREGRIAGKARDYRDFDKVLIG